MLGNIKRKEGREEEREKEVEEDVRGRNRHEPFLHRDGQRKGGHTSLRDPAYPRHHASPCNSQTHSLPQGRAKLHSQPSRQYSTR